MAINRPTSDNSGQQRAAAAGRTAAASARCACSGSSGRRPNRPARSKSVQRGTVPNKSGRNRSGSRRPGRVLTWLLPIVVLAVVGTGILIARGIEPPLPPVHRNLQQVTMGPPTATLEQAEKWARRKSASDEFIGLAALYWQLAPEYGVNPAVAYAQAGLETNYGRFGGVIDATYHNPCGMKTAAGGDDAEPAAHARFETWETGIRAQLEHICLYAGAAGYPLSDPIDPRHFPYLLGVARTVGEIGERWASSEHYANLLAELINRMEVQYVPGQTTHR